MPSPITPGLIVLHGNRLELLRDAVLDWLRQNPLDPLEPELMLVQSNGVAEWLKIALAERAGVCAATEAMLPARFLWQAYRRMLGKLPQRSPLDKAALTWRLMRRLPALCGRPGFEPLARFLADPAPERRLQLAQRLADLFDQYQVYRADWLADWGAGRDTLRLANGQERPLADEQRWQAMLWREMVDDAGDGAEGRADIHRRFLDALAAGQAPAGPLPRRVVLFGMSSLPLQTLEAIAALATHTQVLLAVPNPCQFYWGDIMDGRELLRAARHRQRDKGASLADVPLEDLHQHTHPLLASWGRQGRDFIRMLDAFDDAQATQGRHPGLRVDLFDEDDGATLLQQVQSAVRDLKPLAEHDGRLPDGDRSIEFHVTHGTQREVEVLHDRLLAMLADTPGLTPRDVVVMVPQIEDFSPSIRAVFGQYGAGDPRHIPYEVADVKDRSVNPLLGALHWLLRLPTQRCRQSEVRNLLDVPALAARFGLDDADGLAVLARWLDGAGVRWGLDAEHRATLGLGNAGEQNSWLFGVRRMLLGYACGDGQPFADIAPYGDVGGLDAALAGSLAQLVDALILWRGRLAQAARPDEWATLAQQLLDAFFLPQDERDTLTLDALRQALARWQEDCADAGYDEAVPLAVLREAWLPALDEPSLDHRFVSGGVTFCTLMPMRAVPFRVVCLLGMNDGAYPRSGSHADFDLLREPGLSRPGDRSRSQDDRYLMLEALLSARDKLYISWAGRNVRDNTEQPPSLLVSQLVDYLKAGWRLDPARLTTLHPLQPFSRRYFEQGGLTTYAREWRAAHAETRGAQAELAPYTPDPDFRLSLQELTRFLKNPASAFFRRRLRVVFTRQDDAASDDEPFALNALDQYWLADALLQASSALPADSDAETTAHCLSQRATRLLLSGSLPVGLIGQRERQRLVQELLPMSQVWLALCARYPGDEDKLPLTFHHQDIHLEDWLDRLRRGDTGSAWLASTPGRIARQDRDQTLPRPDKLLDGWLRQLLTAAQGQPVTGYLVGRDALATLAPLEPDAARDTLRTLLDAWRQGMDQPLPTACKTGLALVLDDNPAPHYDGSFGSMGEGEDPCLARLWPGFAALSAEPRWEDWSRTLYQPLADWLQQSVTMTSHPDDQEDAA